MRYIRFLKPPKVQGQSIKALITITSDLGESFLPDDVQLRVNLRHDLSGEIYLQKNVKWNMGMRSLPLAFDISNCDVHWPVRVHISLQGASSDSFEKDASKINLPSIISAWSDILDPSKGINEASRTVERRFTASSECTIRMWEETGESIARHLWDAGIALSAQIALRAGGIPLAEQFIGCTRSQKLNVMELGSGCGIVGISLAQSVPNCDVILTDLPEAAEIVQRNLDVMRPATSSTANFIPLLWEEPLPKEVCSRSFGLILVADCTYNPDSSSALVKTLSVIVESSPDAVVLLAMKIRHSSELIFFDHMEKANFITASQMKLPLPCGNEEAEEVIVYAFHHKDRLLHANEDSG